LFVAAPRLTYILDERVFRQHDGRHGIAGFVPQRTNNERSAFRAVVDDVPVERVLRELRLWEFANFDRTSFDRGVFRKCVRVESGTLRRSILDAVREFRVHDTSCERCTIAHVFVDEEES